MLCGYNFSAKTMPTKMHFKLCTCVCFFGESNFRYSTVCFCPSVLVGLSVRPIQSEPLVPLVSLLQIVIIMLVKSSSILKGLNHAIQIKQFQSRKHNEDVDQIQTNIKFTKKGSHHFASVSMHRDRNLK